MPGADIALLRIEIEIPQQRYRQFRRLFAGGLAIHVYRDTAKYRRDLQPGNLKFAHQCRGEGTVAPGAIGGDGVGLRRIGDQHALRAFDLGKASRRAGATGAFVLGETFREWVVAAGVQHQ